MMDLNTPHQGIERWGREVIVVTGSSGLIGSRLIEAFSDQYTVVGLDNPGYPYPPARADCISMDITSDESVQEAFRQIREKHGNRISSFIHLSAYYNFSGGSWERYEQITIRGTERVLKQLAGFDVEQFVFASSLLVYQPTVPGKKLTEDSPVNPAWEYPKSKVQTEQVIRDLHGAMPVVFLRIAGVYSNTGNSIPITHQIQRIYNNELTAHLYPGNQDYGNVFLHVEDLVNALLLCIQKRGRLPPEVVLNLGEPEPVSYKALQDEIAGLLYHKEWTTHQIPKPLAKLGAALQNLFSDPFIKPWMIDRTDDHYEIDISRAKALLGWQPQHALMTTLPLIIAALKADPEEWLKENKLET